MIELPKPEQKGACPHCGINVIFNSLKTKHPRPPDVDNVPTSESIVYEDLDSPNRTQFRIWGATCPSCNGSIIIRQKLVPTKTKLPKFPQPYHCEDDLLLWPRGPKRQIPPEVPKEIAKDYRQACEVLFISEFASAVLSRRCLQHIIHDAAKQHNYSLEQEIKAIKKTLPDELKELPTLVRLLGKIAAHPHRDYKTGDVITVEPEEAKLALSVIESLFEHYYLRPTKPNKTKKLANQIRTKASRIQKPPKKG